MTGRQSDDGEVAAFYAVMYARLVGVVSLVSGDRGAAEEVVQEAFARLLPRWSRVSQYDNPEAWLRTVAFRLLSNRRRRSRNQTVALSAARSVADGAGPAEDRIDIARALRSLPLGQRQVVVLHHLVGLPVDDVARQLGLAVGTVKSRLHRARAALAPLLREDSSDDAYLA